ncbi:lipoprotein [Nocardiopsis rhodophaea]|uniref:Lipoprotein n=1 Tax=Nocardiopsis rhodophaea TaxID=280238 RepID=A0ABN2SZ26_9ACTN
MIRSIRPRAGAATVLALAALTGCGIPPTDPSVAGGPAQGIRRPGADTHTARIFFVDSAGPRAVARPVDRPPDAPEAIDLLLDGPSPAERERGLFTEVPPMGRDVSVTATKGTVNIYIPVKASAVPVTAISQIVCTAANADIPGGRPPAEVVVRIFEEKRDPWPLRCGDSGNAYPASIANPTGDADGPS